MRPGRDPRAVARELRILLLFRLSAGGRDPRRGAALVVGLPLLLGVGVPVAVAMAAPRSFSEDAVLLAPAVWFFFVAAAVVGSLASAGGRELLPRRDAVAFPVSSTADQVGAMVLTPLNVAWSTQALVVLTVTAYAVGPRPALASALVAAMLWVLAGAAVANLVGWVAELVRTYRFGTTVLRGVAGLALLSIGLVIRSGGVTDALDALPTIWPFIGAITTDPGRYVVTQLLVAAVGITAVVVAVPVGERCERRPAPAQAHGETRSHRRDRPPSGELGAAVTVDVRSLLRSPPLRRGLGPLLATPLLVAMLFPLPWLGILLLPALIASGTALLHGVNVVALDGRGAVWRESLPHRPDVTLVGRLVALTVLSGGSSLAVVALAALRAPTPTAAETAGVLCAVVLSTVQVVSRCARWSIGRPFPAELRTGRDTPAPPVAMAAYSIGLSVATTGATVLLAVGVLLDSVTLVVVLTAVLLLPGRRRLLSAFRSHRNTAVRSHVVSTVAS